MIRQIEVGGKERSHAAFFVPLDRKGSRLVLPGYVVEVENAGEFCFGLVGESYQVCRWRRRLIVVGKGLFKRCDRAL